MLGNEMVRKLEEVIEKPLKQSPGTQLYTGVDLGTAYIVIVVLDSMLRPVAGAMQFAQVVRDGLVVEYMEAIKIVQNLKALLEEQLGVELSVAATAFPPGVSIGDRQSIKYVVEAAGFEVVKMDDEPSVANRVLGITDGAIVDIGGGTTGIAIVKNGEVVYVADEPTGGTHFTLVLAGARRIPFTDAEAIKADPRNYKEIQPLLIPVMEKVAAIIKRHIQGHKVRDIYLVGGTSCLPGIETVVEKHTGVKTTKPSNPLLVTPLGIAMSCLNNVDQ
jgi:ethanolamine utilization protein EutJ